MDKSISQQLAEKTFQELGIDPKTGKPINGKIREDTGRYGNPPFRIPVWDKTKRQANSTQGYKASATWQTMSLLRDLFVLWFDHHTPVISRTSPIDIRLFSRLKAQILDALRSAVSTFEEGWARPSTKEFLDFIGFTQGSLTEVRGDTERMYSGGLLPSIPVNSQKIPTPSPNFPYPPVNSRRSPIKYGKLSDKLREYTGHEVDPTKLSYEIFIELVNKSNYLLTKTVDGLRNKIVLEEKKKLSDSINSHFRKHW